jgi:CO/xanthine dehydrogenase FAD-binding subunit
LNDASPAGALMEQCRRALWGSFKIWNAATIGGNLCLALPAAPMAALAVALDATCEIWCPDGSNRQVDAQDFILDAQKTCLAHGEILRGLHVPAHALAARYAFRQASLTEEGRSATLVIGRNDAPGLALTITAATRRPLHIRFAIVPDASTLHHAIEKEVAAHGGWFDDKHGAPDWRRHMTLRLAAQITLELAAS